MTQLWTPSPTRIEQAQSSQFIQLVNQQFSTKIKNFHELYQWSVDNDVDFWDMAWDFLGMIGEKGKKVITDAPHFHQRRFFPTGKLNFAEHFLQNRHAETAITFWGEDKVKSSLTFAQLYEQVSKVRQFLIARGVTIGDRIAGVLPNMPETIVAMLATTSLGAVWASASPDFGEQGIIDRFGQIEPKVLFIVNGYYYNGKTFSCQGKIQSVMRLLPSLQVTVVVNYINDDTCLDDVSSIVFHHILASYEVKKIEFTRFHFNHPVYILFSSGTTGAPKCIVHCAGGVLLQHLKELRLHADVKPGDKLFYFTTCGWMMWNWLVSGLAVGATLNLYDGSPFVDGGRVLFDYIDAENINHFGISAKYIDALNKHGLHPAVSHDLSSLQSIFSTGSPLSGHSFDYVYEKIKADVCLSSISGGTDIVSCFVLGSPTLPVNRGQLQTRGLGLAVDVFDENQQSVQGKKGELVCKTPFPCMPIGFWHDEHDQQYLAAYFSIFDNIWCHGDYVELTENNGLIFHGRSDSVLNPGGVRIGTAEIYRQVDKVDAVIDSVVIGQRYNEDIRVVLFVQLPQGVSLSNELVVEIKQVIRSNTSTRHVPAIILQVTDIPKTKSGKVMEIAVRDTVHGGVVKNKTSLANPESLEQFANRPELA
ncbi:MAG: acetoacetate--CoA ligase [Ostreibacterium sp.]